MKSNKKIKLMKGNDLVMKTFVKKDLMEIGFGEYQAKRIIQSAKKELVKRGYSFYGGSKIGRVPSWIVEELIGLNIHARKK